MSAPLLRAVPAFDVCGPMPTGTTVLEASAGTGKTFTIAALAARYVAELDVPLERLLLVTFSRAATQELRDRVRARLVSAVHGLADPAEARRSEDTVLRLLADAPDADVRLRCERIARALRSFDAATIATTHQFCEQVLAGLGVVADVDRDATFVENLDDLVEEVVDDLYVRGFAKSAEPPPFPRAMALTVARDAIAHRHAALAPVDVRADTAHDLRRRLAGAVRAEVDRRKRRRRLKSYDDLLDDLCNVLVHPERGPVAAQRVRDRYLVALVDEFQDTDPVQWTILLRALHGARPLVLIGDPKQAIYSFRAADVMAYLDAARVATTHATLSVNWRSDQPLLDALDVLWGGTALGHPEIAYRRVRAAYPTSRLVGPAWGAPFRLRVLTRDDVPIDNRTGLGRALRSRERVAVDLAADVVRLLSSDARLVPAAGGAADPVRPGDLAVLVRTNEQATLVRDALRAVGVPAVSSGATSVFSTRPAQEWLVLLEALEQPHRPGRVRAAALTCFLGWTAQRLALAGDDETDAIAPLLVRWSATLSERGVAALLELISASQDLPARVLAQEDGERWLTDLRHVGALLHAAAVAESLGTAALVSWLRRRVDEAASDAAEERSRRLESDADAVQVLTVHRSKGLEFPVVYVPFAWDQYRPVPDCLLFHADGERVLDVGGRGSPGWSQRRDRHDAEQAGEDLRLLYVALTRARSQIVAWWAPGNNTPGAPLHRLLFGRRGPGGATASSDGEAAEEPPVEATVPSDDGAAAALRRLAGRASGTIAVEPAGGAATKRWSAPTLPAGVLEAARFDRVLDLSWRRTSYSALTAAAHEAGAPGPAVASEPETEELGDERESPGVASGDRSAGRCDPALSAVILPMGDLPGGAAFGTLVHAVLETTDTTAADLDAELAIRVAEQLAKRSVPGVDPDRLVVGLRAALDTPLGGLAPGVSLRDVAPADRLAELDFELPLVGGDQRGGAVTAAASGPAVALADIAELMRRHVPAGHPLGTYPDRLEAPALPRQVRGYLAGSIDAVLRLRSPEGDPRYVVVDYKTNRLGTPIDVGPLTAWHYRPGALATGMMAAHYPLQALLYSVALHRYLRWRQPGYAPERHLGGVLYLFLRGMAGPATPLVDGQPCGVFAWQPSAGLVVELSHLLDGECP